MSYRIAESLDVLRGQVDARWPGRDKTSDGWIADAAHAARASDHNPNAAGIVTALDITHDPQSGCDTGKIAEAIRASRDPRVKYLIFNRRISNSASIGGKPAWAWRVYSGSSPHSTHLHVSVLADRADDEAPWVIEKEADMPEGKEHYDRKIFFDAVRKSPFGGSLTQEQVDGMNAFLKAWEPVPFTDRRWLAYCLATIKAETGTMLPREEVGKGDGKQYGVADRETGKKFFGRGLVQLTWKANYERATEELNERNLVGRKVDLVNKPEQALEPDISSAVLIYGMAEGWFTGHSLKGYFNDDTSDWTGARKIVNGTDRASEIAGYGQAFNLALSLAATVEEPEQPDAAKPEPAPEGDPAIAEIIARAKAMGAKVSITITLN